MRLAWTTYTPVLAVLALVATWGRDLSTPLYVVVALLLGAAVLASVHHAEVVAHRVGEPMGSLVLAVAVTVIEVALIVTLMVSGGKDTSTLARDTVFAAVMITCNGIVGLCLFVGGVQLVLLALTVVVSVLTVVPGRATRLQGGVHLVLFAAFVFLAINP